MKLREKIEKYINITKSAIGEAELKKTKNKKAILLIEMAKNYYKDALYFLAKKDYVNAFAAINYAHAFLDAAALLGLIKTKNRKLFMVD